MVVVLIRKNCHLIDPADPADYVPTIKFGPSMCPKLQESIRYYLKIVPWVSYQDF